MSDDFDDDLYNVYNGGGLEDTYNDEDLYGEDPVVDAKEEDAHYEEKASDKDQTEESNQQEQQQQPPQQQQQRQQQQNNMRYQQQNMMNNNTNWGFQGNPYQQYMAAYQQNLQRQMAVNPYQMQQMIQRQMRQHMPQQQQQQRQVKKESTEEGDGENPDEGKMFIGGLNWETTDESLRQYFSQFGEVLDCNVMRDPTTQRSRGFGFLTMKENADIDKIVSQADHQLDGKRIDPKRAIPRDEQDKTEKIFVGGISAEVNEEEFREFFTQFGNVIDATLMLDRDTGRPRGFGFITFESSDGVEEALKNPNLAIKDKTIEVKKAMPKNKQNRMAAATPVLNPNFRPQQGYMPNNRYAGAANFGNMNNFNQMYGNNMYGGAYNNMAAAAVYYNNTNNNNRGYRHKDDHNTRGDDNRRNSRDRGGGAIHASQSRNQHYRPY